MLVLISLGAVTYIVSYFVGDDTKRTAEENNHTLNQRSAASAEAELTTIRSNSFLLLDMLSSAGNSAAMARQTTTFFFERNQGTAAILLYNVETDRNDRTLINSRFFLSNELDEGFISTFQETNKDSIQRAARGEVFVLSGAPIFGIPILALLYPWQESGLQQAAVVLFSAESLTEVFGTGSVNQSFVVNHNEDLLVHSDFDLIKAGANFYLSTSDFDLSRLHCNISEKFLRRFFQKATADPTRGALVASAEAKLLCTRFFFAKLFSLRFLCQRKKRINDL